MTTIVMNTLNGAVSEYDWQFQSITERHGGDVTGLYAFGGGMDGVTPIDALITTPRLQWGASIKKMLDGVYFSMNSDAASLLRVHCTGADWEYPVGVSAHGTTRTTVGRGIRENYLAFSFINQGGGGFQLDRIEVREALSKSRRL